QAVAPRRRTGPSPCFHPGDRRKPGASWRRSLRHGGLPEGASDRRRSRVGLPVGCVRVARPRAGARTACLLVHCNLSGRAPMGNLLGHAVAPLALIAGLWASAADAVPASETRVEVVTPGPGYGAGWFRRLLLGEPWRG